MKFSLISSVVNCHHSVASNNLLLTELGKSLKDPILERRFDVLLLLLVLLCYAQGPPPLDFKTG